MLKRLILRVRPLRLGHHHDRCQVIFLRPFFEILQFVVVVVLKVLRVHLLYSSYYSFH
jgi:hypothetical protein